MDDGTQLIRRYDIHLNKLTRANEYHTTSVKLYEQKIIKIQMQIARLNLLKQKNELEIKMFMDMKDEIINNPPPHS